jgi:hypothetical protein
LSRSHILFDLGFKSVGGNTTLKNLTMIVNPTIGYLYVSVKGN